jgi:hypothetical protein
MAMIACKRFSGTSCADSLSRLKTPREALVRCRAASLHAA